MKAIIFDMDGVIFDSERATYLCWQEIADKYGLKDMALLYKKLIGVTVDVNKKTFFDFYGADIPYDEMLKERRKLFKERYGKGKLPIKKGVRELLQYLKDEGYTIAIASSTRTDLVKEEIEDAGLLDFFDSITGGDKVTRSKPNPDIFIEASMTMGIKSEDRNKIIVIEDSFNGIRAASSAGMYPVMVPDMLEPDEEMREKAAIILPDLLEVKEWLKTFSFL